MRKLGFIAGVLIITILMALVLIAGCSQSSSSMAGKTPQSSGQLTPTTIPTSSLMPTPTPTFIPTASPNLTQIELKTYSNYGFSFKYPEGIAIIESGFEGVPNLSGGIVYGRNARELLTINWVKTDLQPANLDIEYLNRFKDMQNNPNFINFSFGNIETKSHLGNTVSTINGSYKLPDSDQQYYGQAAWWYCPESNRSYFISFDTVNDSNYAKNTLMTYLDSFKCH